jgi:hypothetical protein
MTKGPGGCVAIRIALARGSLRGCVPRPSYPRADTTAWANGYQRFFRTLPVDVVLLTRRHRLARPPTAAVPVRPGR